MTASEAIKWLKGIDKKYIHGGDEGFDNSRKVAISTAISALEKQIPKKPKHIHKEYEKHQWKKDKKGNVDEWAWDNDYCHGAICKRCREPSDCVDCYEEYDKGPCVIDKHVCPSCKKTVYHEKHCDNCGQALDWSDTE